MGFTPRPYQAEAIDKGIDFFSDRKKKYNAIEILPTGAGKSLVVANIASGLHGNTLILQPSKEILAQNYEKFTSYGFRAGIYSASLKEKYVDKVTFATIGSIATKHHLFKEFSNIIVDECHRVNSKQGMYKDLIKTLGHTKVLGLTATPYRLSSAEGGAMLKFLTRTRPKIFNKVLHYVQNDVLFNAGFLAPLEYYSFDLVDRNRLETNSTGTDFSDASLKSYYQQIGMTRRIIDYANQILQKRKNLLVFCSLVEEAKQIAAGIPGAVVVHGETDPVLRDSILRKFKAGLIRCVVNVKILDTGFDFPALEAVLLSRSTMSLEIYYQILGRVMRPFTYPDGTKKSGWVVDLGGNIRFFGKIETMKIQKNDKGEYSIWNNGRQLTNVAFSKN